MKLFLRDNIFPYKMPTTIFQRLRLIKCARWFMFIGTLQLQVRAMAQDITLSLKDAPITAAFHEITSQTGYDFVYSNKVKNQSHPVTINLNNVPIKQALSACLNGQPLKYSIFDSTIVVNYAPLKLQEAKSSLQDSLIVSGQVKDPDDNPLVGVTIRVKGTDNGSLTDADGSFTIHIPQRGDILLFTFIGYQSKALTVVDQDRLNVTLYPVNQKLAEVTISTGYQTIAKERSAGSFSKPSMDIIENRSTGMNILKRMDGLVAGLTVNNSPSAAQNPFLIRGLSTVGIPTSSGNYYGTNRNPLYVVDGIPMDDVAAINPQNVKDITVLKDATAASIWGSRASNGVIVITTKKGKPNEKIKVQYDGFISFRGKPNIAYFPMMNSKQFVEAARATFNPALNPWNTVSTYHNLGSTGISPEQLILYNQYRGLISKAEADKSLDSLSAINNITQIKDLWYRNAILTHHTLSVTGGGKHYSVYGSLAYTGTRDDRPGNKDNAYDINLRQDFKLNNHIRFYLITDLRNRITSAKRQVAIDNRFYPYQLFKDANGDNLSMPYMGYLSDSQRIAFQKRSHINLDYSPLDDFNDGYTKSNELTARIIGGATINLFKGLRFEGVYGYIKGTNKTYQYDDTKSYPVRTEVVQFTVAPTDTSIPIYYLPAEGGKYSIIDRNQLNWTIRNQLIYDNAWNDRVHQLTILLGQEAQEQLTSSNRSTVRGYNEMLQTFVPIDYATLGSTGVTDPVMSNDLGKSTLTEDAFNQSEIKTRFVSYYANAAYTYNDKYTLNASWRIDQSNLFGIDKSAQNRPVWSLGAKWIISNERFMDDMDWLNHFALRTTYGITGNSPLPGTASSFDIMAPKSSSFLPGGVGLMIYTPANRRLTWESTKTVNFGLDFSLLDYRLSGSIDLYQKKTTNLLGKLSTNIFTGYSAIIGNFGDLQNKGIEVTIQSMNVADKNFSWHTILTLAYNYNKITKLNTLSPITTGDQKIEQNYLAGFPAFALFAYRYAGLDTLGDPMIRLSDKSVSKEKNAAAPGDILFMGTYQPKWSGGVSNTIRYKNLSFSINAVYNLGYVMRRDVNPYYTDRMRHRIAFLNSNKANLTTGNLYTEFQDRWKKPGDEAFTNIPAYVSDPSVSDSRRDINYYKFADINILNASYIKIRDMTLSYSLPSFLVDKIKTDDLTLRIQISNLALWKANKYDIDPEFQDAIHGHRSMPFNQKTITLGAHITF